MFSWQFLRLSVRSTSGPIDATYSSKMRVMTVLSSERMELTVEDGHPVPPYVRPTICTSSGLGASWMVLPKSIVSFFSTSMGRGGK